MAGGSTDTVPARLTPGEFVIKRGSAEMLGLPFLRQLNAVSDSAAHENIDALMAMAELSNMKPMIGGGEVVPGYKNGGRIPIKGYQDGDLVETFKDAIIAGRTPFGKKDLFGRFIEHQPNPETGMFDVESIAGIPSDGGERQYYLGKASGETQSEANQLAHMMALANAVRSPSETIAPGDVESYFKPKGGIRGALSKIFGYQYGGKVKPMMGMQPRTGLREMHYQDGGSVGEAGREYLPGTLMSGTYGDSLNAPGAGGMAPNSSAIPDSILNNLSPGEAIDRIDEAKNNLNALKAGKVLEMIQLQGIYNEPNESGYFKYDLDVPANRADELKKSYSILRDVQNQKALDYMMRSSGQMMFPQ